MTLDKISLLEALSDGELQAEIQRRRDAVLAARSAAEEVELQAIRKAYMDKYDGGTPTRGPEAYMANISFLEAELVRVRVILRNIKSHSCMAGLDRGNATVDNLAASALTIPLSK